jgi:hypothetical protein
LHYSLDEIELEDEPDYWALRVPSSPEGQRRLDTWSRGEPCVSEGARETCLETLDSAWDMDRGWSYQGADERSFMVTTRADRVERHDSNGALLELFEGLDQADEMLFYVGVLGYVPRCSTVERDADGVWTVEVDLVTSDCPRIDQHQLIQVRPDGTLHTVAVLQTERGADCARRSAYGAASHGVPAPLRELGAAVSADFRYAHCALDGACLAKRY